MTMIFTQLSPRFPSILVIDPPGVMGKQRHDYRPLAEKLPPAELNPFSQDLPASVKQGCKLETPTSPQRSFD
jgi:hypothetical protein